MSGALSQTLNRAESQRHVWHVLTDPGSFVASQPLPFLLLSDLSIIHSSGKKFVGGGVEI